MTEQQIKVSCPGCGTKFHVPEYLVRGKQIHFRCRRCRGTIPVDGRAMPRDASPTGLEGSARLSMSDGLPTAEMFPKGTPTLDTPAGFAQAIPPSQRTRSSTDGALIVPTAAVPTAPPIAMSRSERYEDGRLSGEPPPFSQRGLRGKKWVVASAIAVAAGFTIWSMANRPASPTPLGTLNPPRGDERASAPTGGLHPREPQAGTGEAATLVAAPATAATIAPPTTASTAEAPKGALAAPRSAKDRTPKSTIGTETARAAELAAPQETAPAAADTPPTHEIEFNTTAAREALEQAGQRTASCRTIDAPAGAARVAVTFAPNGSVTSAVIESGPFVGTPAGTCVASKFRAVRVPPFTGDEVIVHKTVSF